LEAPTDVASEADVRYRVCRAPLERSPPLATRSDDPTRPWAIERWYSKYVLVEFPTWAAFEVRRNEVVLRERWTDDDDLVIHLLLDHVIPRVVAFRGELMLHGSGVVGPSGRAHLFLGATGTGKSTLAATLAAEGWPLLDDDGIRVASDAGDLLAMPGYAGIRLLADAAAHVLPGARGRPMTRTHHKLRFARVDHALPLSTDPVPIAAVYLLQRTDVVEPSVVEMPAVRALQAVTSHAFHLAPDVALITRQAFEHGSRLVSSVPVRVLRQPAGLEHLGRTEHLLRDLDRRV
jgi:hypothetical protein